MSWGGPRRGEAQYPTSRSFVEGMRHQFYLTYAAELTIHQFSMLPIEEVRAGLKDFDDAPDATGKPGCFAARNFPRLIFQVFFSLGVG